VVEERFVSMAAPNLAAQRVTFTPRGWSGACEVRAAIDGVVRNANVPLDRAYPSRHIKVVDQDVDAFALDARLNSGGSASIAAHHGGDARWDDATREGASLARSGVLALRADRPATVQTIVALDAARSGAVPKAAALLPETPDYDALRAAHAAAWEKLWSDFELTVEDVRTERTLRFHVFHLMQTISPHAVGMDAGVPARGWHGEGYFGHVFWDEIFVIPVLAARFPECARAMLMYRYRRLGAARENAREAGYDGAMYPWRSAASGRETTPRFQCNPFDGEWMRDHTALQRHSGAAIARNIRLYADVTGDSAFLAGPGAEMLAEIARFFASLAEEGDDGRFHIRGVVGPDEYQTGYPGTDAPGLTDNAYTNIMAAWTLRCACDVIEALDDADANRLRARLAVGPNDLSRWADVSRRLAVPIHETADGPVLSQFAGYERLKPPEALPDDIMNSAKRLDWALLARGDSANAYQMSKQADVLASFIVLGDDVWPVLERLGVECDEAMLVRTIDYYLARTAHRSSLSHIVFASALSVACPERSWAMYQTALDTDLYGGKGQSTAGGIHLGAMAGTIGILQHHYLGLSVEDGALVVRPRLPPALGAVRMALAIRGTAIEVTSTAGGGVTITSRSGPVLPVHSAEGRTELAPGGTVSVPSALAPIGNPERRPG